MEISIRGDKLTITKAMKEQVSSKMQRLEKYFEDPNSIVAHVKVKVNNLSQIIEITIPTKIFTLRAEESNEDLYTALDLVVDKLERQIRKNKTKMHNKYKDSEKFDINLDFEITELETDNSKIVKRKNMEMKPMDEEEALLQAELLDHPFFVFKNTDEECVSVLYKRKDNLYGIINVK